MKQERRFTVETTEEGKITASKSALNYLSILASEAAERYSQLGLHALSKRAKKFSNELYDALDEVGYYK